MGYGVRGMGFEVRIGKKDKNASRKSGGCSIDPFHINK